MNTMYVYEVESKKIVATVNAANNKNCENLARIHNLECEEYGWCYNDNVLTRTEATQELFDAEYIDDPLANIWEM
jgi:hypothetical protein